MGEFEVPSWVITFMPLLVLVVTFLVAKVPQLAALGKRNLGAIVACITAIVVIALNPPVLAGGDVMEYVSAVVALILYWWKGAQIIFDLFTGQIGTPESHAT